MDLPGTEQHGKDAEIGFGFFPGGGLEPLSLATGRSRLHIMIWQSPGGGTHFTFDRPGLWTAPVR
jgi:hypothetical protein